MTDKQNNARHMTDEVISATIAALRQRAEAAEAKVAMLQPYQDLCFWLRIDVLQYGVNFDATNDWLAKQLALFSDKLADLSREWLAVEDGGASWKTRSEALQRFLEQVLMPRLGTHGEWCAGMNCSHERYAELLKSFEKKP